MLTQQVFMIFELSCSLYIYKNICHTIRDEILGFQQLFFIICFHLSWMHFQFQFQCKTKILFFLRGKARLHVPTDFFWNSLIPE